MLGLSPWMSPVSVWLSVLSLIAATGRYFRGKCNTALSKEIMNLMQKVFFCQSFKLWHEKQESLWLLICTSLKQPLGFFL